MIIKQFIKDSIKYNFNKIQTLPYLENFERIIKWKEIKKGKNGEYLVPVNYFNKQKKISINDNTPLNGNVWLCIKKNNNDYKYQILTIIPNQNSSKKFTGTLLSSELKLSTESYSYYKNGFPILIKKEFESIKKQQSTKNKSTNYAGKYDCNTIKITVCAGGLNGSEDKEICNSRYKTTCKWTEDNQSFSENQEVINWIKQDEPGGNPDIEFEIDDEQIKEQIKNKPFALFGDLDCNIIRKWIATAKFKVSQNQINKLNSIKFPNITGNIVAKIQEIDNAYSSVVNMDYFPVNINKLPYLNGKQLSPSEFKEYIRKNINNFIDSDKGSFTTYARLGINDNQLWNSSNPINSIIGINIPGLLGINDPIFDDDGAVILSQFSNSSWTFTTIFDPIYGIHPVSGNRDFGYSQNPNGSIVFYTRGVDRLTNMTISSLQSLSGVPFSETDKLWTSFQNQISSFVNKNGGDASVGEKEIRRPKWSVIQEVIEGKKPLSYLSTDCKD